MFLDGKLVGIVNNSFLFPPAVSRPRLNLGASGIMQDLQDLGADTQSDRVTLNGTMRDLHVWDIALSDSDIHDLYLADKGRFRSLMERQLGSGHFPSSVLALGKEPIVSHYVTSHLCTLGHLPPSPPSPLSSPLSSPQPPLVLWLNSKDHDPDGNCDTTCESIGQR